MALAAPSTLRRAGLRALGDRAFAVALTGLGLWVLVIAGVIVTVCYRLARPAFAKLGVLPFLAGSDWNPVEDSYGALPFLYGTLVTSAVAILVALPVAIGLALFLVEMAPAWVRKLVSFLVELLAAIPSVVYGLWGLFVLVPWLRETVEPALGRWLGFLPLFRGPPIGVGYLAAGLILALMILPTITAVSVEVLRTAPATQREGALALGATRWEAIRMASLPYARRGIVGATILGLGRALGETMAVTMLLGNQPEIHASLFAAGYSLPAVIANEFAEATGDIHIGALAALALVLCGTTFALNAAARLLIRVPAERRTPARASA
ncbi:MAG: phosphate ABC transporter permease subunit PstC [Myxococcales bacterium]|nr:phosphate ABC transporter permease subunit PstC [Myxococcales bacterium]